MIYLIGYFVIGLLACYIQIQLLDEDNLVKFKAGHCLSIIIFWLPLLIGFTIFGIIWFIDMLFENIGEKLLKVIKSLKL